MADILLSFGVATSEADVSEIQKGLEKIITKIEKNPPKVRVGLTVDDDAIKHFKKQLEAVLNTVGLANGTPITLNISGLGEISAQATEAANAMKRAAGATKQHGSALTPVLNSYREMHALMRKNQNATDATTESYKGVRAQADFFKDALELSRRESVSIEVAFARMGVSIDTALKNATDSMAKLKAEMEHTGQSGTVTAKQVYDTVAKMREAISKNKNASNLGSYQAISSQLGNWEAAADLVRQGGATVEQALSQIGSSSDSASAKVVAMSTALSSLNEEMKRTGTSGTTTRTQIDDALSQANSLLQSNGSAFGLKTFTELQTLLSRLSPLMGEVKADGSDLFDKLEQGGFEASTVVKTLQDAMAALKTEIATTGQSGTVSAKQLYDTVAKMHEAVNKNKNASNLGSYQAISSQLGNWEAAADLVRQGGATVEQVLAQIGNSSDSASTKIANMSTALSSLNEEMKRTGTTGTTTQKATGANLVDTMRQMETLLNQNQNASHLSAYKELSNQLDVFKSNIYDSNGAMRSMADILSQFGTTADSCLTTAKERMSAFRAEIEHSGTAGTTKLASLKQVAAQMSDIINQQAANPTKGTSQAFDELLAKYNQLQAVMRNITKDTSMGEVLNGIGVSATQAFEQAKEAISGFKTVAAGATDELTDASAQIRRLDTLINQVEANLGKWTKARSGNSKESYKAIEQELDALRQMRAQIASTGTAMNGFTGAVGASTAKIQKHSTAIKDAKEDTKSLSDRFGGLATKFGSWLTVSQAVMAAIRAIKKMVSTVVELDAAMTELKKVTNESDATYDRFLTKATERAKKLGASLSDVVSATADFARLGYGVEDASKLADVALLYKNIGDGVEDITQASESIVSTMQAFGILPDKAAHIVDVFNSIGNNFAISSGGIGEALQRSAAAMNAAGNTLEETAALVAAANTVVQNPDSVGTTLKTVSMFLRASKVEAEEAGESTEGMANSVSELREQLLALTRGRVDILTDSGQYKSTYEILRDIASVWDDIVSNQGTDSAAILELIGGKRNANVVAAILENFETAEKALSVALDSTGSAVAENEKHLESITGRISQFQSAWETLSTTVVNSGLVKCLVSFGTTVLNIIDSIAKFSGSMGVMLALPPLIIAAYSKFEKFKLIVDGVLSTFKNFVGGAKGCLFEYAHYTVMVTLNESQ